VVAQASTDFPRRQKVVWSATALASAVSGFVVARLVGPEATEVYNPWLITPAESFNYLGANIGRAGPMAQVLLTGLLPLVLVVAAFRSSRRSELDAPRPVVWACVTGIAVGALLNVQALLSAQWDGRTLWTVYPFVFALGAVALDRHEEPGLERDAHAGVVPVDQALALGRDLGDRRGVRVAHAEHEHLALHHAHPSM